MGFGLHIPQLSRPVARPAPSRTAIIFTPVQGSESPPSMTNGTKHNIHWPS